jgi:hypothetical protein
MKPVLLIKKKLEISKNGTFPQSDTIQETHLIGILVENRGHSAAENCQGCIITNDGKKETWWANKRSNITINVKDCELLNLFYIYRGSGRVNSASLYTFKGGEPANNESINFCKVRVTSQNAEPVETDITIDINSVKIDSK